MREEEREVELDDLRQAWQAGDGKQGSGVTINARAVQLVIGGRVETATRRLWRLLWIELLANAAATLWLGSFIASNLGAPRFVIPAAALDAGVIALLMAGVRQLAAINGVDYSGPVLKIQARLEALKAERIRATMLTLMAAPVAWVPFLVVALKGLFGVDAYQSLSGAWLIANVLFGVLVLAFGFWTSRHYSDRVKGSPGLQRLMDHLAGRSLAGANEHLRFLAEFEAETA